MDNKTEKNRKVLLPSEAGALAGDDIYFFSSEYNLLYKVHMPDFSATIISRIPCEKGVAFKWFRKMRYWKGKLILIPSCAEKIWIYDLKSKEWMDIAIEYPQISLKFWGTVIYQDHIFLFGAAYPAILKINLNDYSVVYLEISCPSEQKKEENGLFFTDAVRIDNMAFSPVSISNHVMWLNLDTLEYGWQQIGGMDNEYCGIAHDGDSFWIPSWEHGRIVKWDGNSRWEEFELPEEIANRTYQFTGVVCDGNKIKFLTLQSGKSLEILKDTSGISRILLTEETKKYIHWEHYEDGTIVLMRDDAGMDVKWKGAWIKGNCEIAYEAFKAYFGERSLRDVFAEKGIVSEMNVFEGNDYINTITEHQKSRNNSSGRSNAGINIWRRLG